MYSSSSKPTNRYKPPSKSANYESPSVANRSRSNFDEMYDETWPLDEVINKIDIKTDEETDDDDRLSNNYTRNIQTWRSGPQLISQTGNSGSEMKRIPGEGALYSSYTEGTKVWKDKQVRRHDYSSKRGSQFDLSTKYTKPGNPYDTNNNMNDYSDRSDYLVSPIPRLHQRQHPKNYGYGNVTSDTSDDDSNVDDDDSPTLRDVGIQCNLRKYGNNTNSSISSNERVIDHLQPQQQQQQLVTTKPPIRVIKSQDTGLVSAYSDVPRLQSPMRSIETRHKVLEDDFSDELLQPTTPGHNNSDVIYSQVNKSAKTKNNNNINIIYKQPMNESRVSYRSGLNDSRQYDTRTKETGFAISNAPAIGPKINLANPMDTSITSTRSSRLRDRSNEKEIIEETISLSNTSEDSFHQPPTRGRETDLKKVGGGGGKPNRTHDDVSFTGNSITSKSSSTYRRNSPARYDRGGSRPSNAYGTIEKNKSKSSKKKPSPNDENVLLANNSLRLKSSKSTGLDRLYKSNADLRDQYYRDETRGGLAAAYKNRQSQQSGNNNNNKHRAVSLSRMNAGTPTGDSDLEHQHHCHVPSRHLSQTHLNNISSRCSDAGSGSFAPNRQQSASRTSIQHERDPIVMYIPTVSHQQQQQQQRGTDSPKLTSILRHNSTKSSATTATLPKKSKKAKEAKSSSKEDKKKSGGSSSSSSDKKKDLNRRHSMPKDTKFNWLSKFKLSKSSK